MENNVMNSPTVKKVVSENEEKSNLIGDSQDMNKKKENMVIGG